MKLPYIFLSAALLTFPVYADSLNNPSECPKDIEGDYKAMAPGGVQLVLTVAHDDKDQLTFTYHKAGSSDPEESKTMVVDGNEEKTDTGTIMLYCKDSAVYHQSTNGDHTTLSKFTVTPEGLKIEGVNPPSEGGIYEKIEDN